MIRTLPLGGSPSKPVRACTFPSTLRFSSFLASSLALCLIGGVALEAAAELDDVVGERIANNKTSVKSQGKVDAYSDQTDALLAEYKSVVQQLDALKVYNHQVETLIDAQRQEVSSLSEQIDGVELVGRQITPLMLEMIEGVESFVELDIPFLLEERRLRVAALHEIMVRADVTNSERYRRIMEAYQIENDFGRSIEAYRADL
jgi:hypothetical protein